MAPPKKDAFSDLFNYAQGGLQKSSSGSSLNNFQLKPTPHAQAKPASTNTWGDLDILSPTQVMSPAQSTSMNPLAKSARKNGEVSDSSSVIAAENDLFSFFENQSAPEPQRPPHPSANADPFDFFESNSLSVNNLAQLERQGDLSRDDPSAPRLPVRPNTDAVLLDDEFTDAFSNTDTTSKSGKNWSVAPSADLDAGQSSLETGERDHVLAALMSEGFPIDLANKAIDRVGPDFEKCMRLIIMSSVRPENLRQASSPNDIGGAFQGMSNDLLKKATWLLDKSRKTVIKNINNFQSQRYRREGDDLPAWIASQHKYKGQAIEKKKDGGHYEDYGTDDENINAEEIRRIVQAQRQKEIERQRQRLEAIGRSSSSSSSLNSQGSKARQERETSIKPERVSSSGEAHHSETQSRRSTPSSTSLRSADSSGENTIRVLPRVPKPRAKTPSSSESATLKDAVSEDDLLGLGTPQAPLTRAQRFKQNANDQESYVSPSRRRQASTMASSSSPRHASSEPLNTFAQSDYETHKAKGAASFSSGDYDNALSAYTMCLQSLPEKHELRIVITSNLALTAIKIGNYRLASANCEEGLALIGDHACDSDWIINEKNIKYWYVRLLMRKAESLEMLENFSASLECYMLLVSKYGVNDKKIMDAKRRVNNIVNPPKNTTKPSQNPLLAAANSTPVTSTKNLDQVKSQHMKEKLQEEQKFRLHDSVNDRIQQWSRGKQDNLRSLLMSLSDVLPQHLGFYFITDKKLTINDLMLTKKVKVHYMKVISNIHPDKLGAFQLEDQMICQGVFVTLNKAWDEFKVQNNIS